ncbi:MAG TPA: class I SAM-dependent methyltransferase [Ohtaekwangia sp.]
MTPAHLQKITQPEVQQFIREHGMDDVRTLVLKHATLFELPISIIADQINGRKKIREKVPAYYQTTGIVYPPAVNLEQSSSQRTAEFKLKLLTDFKISGGKAADLTGGFGIDSWFLSHVFKSVDAVEQDDQILSIARHNHTVLGANNITYHSADSSAFLNETSSTYDLVFIDPSRRTSTNQKVFKLSDCSPDIVSLQDRIFEKSNHLLVKTSPLLDIESGHRELKFVRSVIVVSVEDECKEVLFFSEKGFQDEPLITAVNLNENQETFSFHTSEEKNAIAPIADPREYLYEPNASILKAGAFKSIALKFDLKKIQANTHLYAGSQHLPDFPGRIFKIEAFVKSDMKSILPYFPEGKGNVAVRNYPLSAVELKKKTGLKDGGEKYLLGFSGLHKKYLVVANRLK